MNRKKIFGILLILSVLLFVSCNQKEFLQRMQENEEGVRNPTTTTELEDAISKYERRVEDIMLAQNRIAIWYKILGTRYIDSEMYPKALECFMKALEYYPENHNLYYKLGICASNIAKRFIGDFDAAGKNKQYYYTLAEDAYDTALQLYPNYTKAANALAVLCVYELHKPEKAISVLLPVIQRETKNYPALFVLASAHYMNHDFDSAIQIYKQVLETAKDEAVIKSAKENISQIKLDKLR